MPDHEKLDVYKVSIEFMAIAINIADTIPRGYSSLADHVDEHVYVHEPVRSVTPGILQLTALKAMVSSLKETNETT